MNSWYRKLRKIERAKKAEQWANKQKGAINPILEYFETPYGAAQVEAVCEEFQDYVEREAQVWKLLRKANK